MKVYITLGQTHVHEINGITLDHNCVIEFECESVDEGRAKAFDYFGSRWCNLYTEDQIAKNLQYFPRGIIHID